MRQQPAGAVKVYTSKVYCWIGLHAIEKKEGMILTHFRPPLAVDVVGVVALADQTKASISSVDKTIGTALKETLALVAVIVEITCRLVAD